MLRKQILRTNKQPTISALQYFFLPVYGQFKEYYGEHLIGMYIKDEKKPVFIIIFQNDGGSEQLTEIIHYLSLHHCFHGHYVDEENDEIGIEMSLDHEFYDDYISFLKGKYSEFSTKLKQLIEKQYGDSVGKGWRVTAYDSIYPTESKRKAIANEFGVDLKIVPNEVLDPPNLQEREVFLTIKELQEKYGK